MNKIALYIFLLSVIVFASCESENIPVDNLDKENIEIQFSVSNYNLTSIRSATRATDPTGTTQERQVNDFYLFLFPGTGNTTGSLEKYYVDAGGVVTHVGSTNTGSYTASERKVTLSMTRAEAAARDVYIVANVGADLKTDLDAVTTIAGLQDVFKGTAQPWSPNIEVPILMSGNAAHDFITDGVRLESVPLTRAVAKIELNIKLTSGFQVSTGRLAEYKYRYVDFDTRTYVLKPEPKIPNLVSSSVSADKWYDTERISWGNTLGIGADPAPGTGYATVDGKVTELRLITYLNERDEIGATIEIELPRVDDGPLPPPEFGPELYSLPLPNVVARNHWYVYDIEI